MFTGIITGVGRIQQATPLAQNTGSPSQHGLHLTIQAPQGYLDDVQLGDSIALNGACMTVTSIDKPSHTFSIDISAESLHKTAGLNQAGNQVNLEKAMQLQDRLGGHLVSGHVDGIGHVQQMKPVGESWLLEVLAPPELSRFLAYKGSITVNGVSLTVNQVSDIAGKGTVVSINLIPHTVQNTTLGQLQAGSPVNLEIDLIARYVERMLSATQAFS
ncbi:Riboflavin synthase [Saezia sanguinis]|uniref:Riboflavin synthase n=1 Tax=Saezia sanguinis TaxID=1965230 RepID=A0A433SBN4_9BURK|nr:riboflavin synthase [Saezia sanguinis]RUS66133.1 Riboflavin synthase [Saezia sanguinis]